MIDLGVLLRVPYVETEMGFDISPDGTRVAFSWNAEGSWQIYQLSLGSETGSSQPELLTRGSGSRFHPRYSPDGRSLAFALDRDGGEHYQIHVHDLQSHQERELTAGIDSFIQPFFSWSPDGREIAFISDETGEFAVHITALDPVAGQARVVYDPGFPAWKVFWSPNGRHLAVVSEASGQDYGLHLYSLADGGSLRVCLDGRAINAKDPAWSADSQRLAFSSDVDGNYQIGIYELGSGRVEWITSGAGQKQVPAWSSDASHLVYTVTHGTVSWLAVQALGAAPQLKQVEPGVHYLPRFLPGERRIVLAFDNPRLPTDLWAWTASGGFVQLTHSLPPALEAEEFLLPEEIHYPGLDGKPVPALLFVPARGRIGPSDPGSRPAVVLVHGGPDWHFEMTWYPLMAHLASRGWVVLVPNYRGSTGYGRDWQTASRFDYGGVDAQDVIAGADYLAREGLANPARIAVTGRSHGGYLTACCLTGRPELWAVGSAVVPFLDWFINHEEIRQDLRHWDLENFGDPVKDRELWMARSPSNYLERIRAPLQLICGRHDARCPVRDSEHAYTVLKAMGKQVEMHVYENEGHAFLNIENIIDAEEKRVAFLARHLDRAIPGGDRQV